MKLLFDQNISYRAAKHLQEDFPGSKHLSDCGLMDKDDPDIWIFAKRKDLSIVTYDADFYEISVLNGHPPKILWLRTGNLTTHELVELFKENVLSIKRFLEHQDFKLVSCMEIE